MDEEQKQKIAALLEDQHVLVIATQGEEWPTTTMQAFAETDNLGVVVIMANNSEKYQNLIRDPKVTVHVDTRDKGIERFRVARASIRGVAREVPKDSAEWNQLKGSFLKKNPFEEPFFGRDTLRMISIAPKRIEYANGLSEAFVITL